MSLKMKSPRWPRWATETFLFLFSSVLQEFLTWKLQSSFSSPLTPWNLIQNIGKMCIFPGRSSLAKNITSSKGSKATERATALGVLTLIPTETTGVQRAKVAEQKRCWMWTQTEPGPLSSFISTIYGLRQGIAMLRSMSSFKLVAPSLQGWT